MQKLGKKLKILCTKLDSLNQYSSFVSTIASGIAVILTIAKDYLVAFLPTEDLKFWANCTIIFLIIAALITIIAFSLLAKIISESKESFISDAFNYLEIKGSLEEYEKLFQQVDKQLGKTNVLMVHTINCFIGMSKVMSPSEDKTFKECFDEMIKKIIYPVLKLVWGSSEEEVFTIAVYMYNPATDLLEDYSSMKDPWMGKEEKGRSWRKGQGHIGLVFDTKKGVVHDSIHDDFKPAPDNQEKSDLGYYNSTITLPIRIDNEDENLRGVFCITSSLKGAFKNNFYLLDKIYKSREYSLLLICYFLEKILDNHFGDDLKIPFEENVSTEEKAITSNASIQGTN